MPDSIATVDDDAIRRAVRTITGRARLYMETGAAVALAPLLTGAVPVAPDKPTVVVLTGGNMDLAQAAALLADAS